MIVEVSFIGFNRPAGKENYRGKVVEHTVTVEYFDDQPMQVPALLVETAKEREIIVQPLVANGYEIKVRRI